MREPAKVIVLMHSSRFDAVEDSAQRPGAPRAPKLITTPQRSRLMGRVRQRGTTPELAVRSALRQLGVSYRLNARELPGSPDVANRSKRFAVFVHGCYWHRHPGCRLTTTPSTNVDFWLEKFSANQARD